jgi:hypothetical protein
MEMMRDPADFYGCYCTTFVCVACIRQLEGSGNKRVCPYDCRNDVDPAGERRASRWRRYQQLKTEISSLPFSCPWPVCKATLNFGNDDADVRRHMKESCPGTSSTRLIEQMEEEEKRRKSESRSPKPPPVLRHCREPKKEDYIDSQGLRQSRIIRCGNQTQNSSCICSGCEREIQD